MKEGDKEKHIENSSITTCTVIYLPIENQGFKSRLKCQLYPRAKIIRLPVNTLTISVTIIKASSSIAVTASAADKSSLTPKDAAKLLLANLPRALFVFSHSSISPEGRTKGGV